MDQDNKEIEIKVIRESVDGVTVGYGNIEYEVSREAGLIIRVLLRRIKKLVDINK